MTDQTRPLPMQTRLAQIEPSTFVAESRTVDVVWTTGAKVRRYSPWDSEYYDEELEVSDSAVDLGRLMAGAPVLNSHERTSLESQIGVVQSASIKDGIGHAKLRLSGRADVAGLVKDIADGVIRNISVGYQVDRYEVTRQTGEVPLWRATRWTPTELSFVTVPADVGATVREHAPVSPCAFVRADQAPSQEGSTMTPEEIRAAEAAEAAKAAKAAEAAEVTRAAEAAAKAAAKSEPAPNHSIELSELAHEHRMSAELPAWLRDGKTPDEVRKLILDKLAKAGDEVPIQRQPGKIEAGQDQAEKTRDAGVESLLARAAVMDAGTKQLTRADSSNPFRGFSLFDMARDCAIRSGVKINGLSRMEIIGRAFTQTTSDFPVLLETAMHKALQSAYALQADTWSRFCAIGSVSDFRAHGRYQVGSIGNLDSLTEANEFVQKVIGDGKKESITASTKGNIISLTRQAIINDDMGAFIGLAVAFGRAARRTIEANVYDYLDTNPVLNEDGVALFHTATHGNLAGSGAAPGVATIEAGRVAMASQQDVSGNDYLDLRPAIWVGPMATGGTARVANNAEYDVDVSNKFQIPNKVRGLLRDIVDTPRITGTEWYLFADPAEAPVIEVAFLDDQREPFLESEEGFTVDGTRWKVRLDYGIAAVDYRGAYKNPGG